MKKVIRKTLAMILTFVMAVSLMPTIFTAGAYGAGEGVDKASAIPVSLGSTEITLTYDGETYFSFVAGATTDYIISATGGDGDLYGYLHDNSECIDQDYDYGSFSITRGLTSGSTYYVSAMSEIDGDICMLDISPAITAPTITSATYDASTGLLVVTGSGMTTGDEIDVKKLTLTGEGGSTYTLTTDNVTAGSSATFSVALNDSDRLNVNGILNNAGTASAGLTTYNLAAAENWDLTQSAPADMAGNGISVSNVQKPTITSAEYQSDIGLLIVTCSNLVKQAGENNDIDVTKLTLTGEGGARHTLSNSTYNVEITSATSFSVALHATDKAAISSLLNKNGYLSIDITTYNLSAADDWNGPVTGGNISDLAPNGILVSGFSASPIIANLDGDSAAFTEGGSAVLLDNLNNAAVTDSDSASFSGGTLTASITVNRVPGEDQLSIANSGTEAGQIGVNGSDVTYGGTIIGTFTGGTGANDLVVTFNISATPEAATALIKALTYLNTNNAQPSTAARTIGVTVSDGGGGISESSYVTVSVTGVNDAPVLTATALNPTFYENGAAVSLFGGAYVSTVEPVQTLTELNLTFSYLYDDESEILNIDGTDVALTHANSVTTAANSISCFVSISGSTATVTIAGSFSAEDMQNLINSIKYKNSSENSTAGNRAITITSIRDSGGTASGGADMTALSIASTVTVTLINDAPVLDTSGTITLTSITEDDDNPAGDTVAAIVGDRITDDDSGALEGVAVTALSGQGVWQYNTGSGWSDIGPVSNMSALLLSDEAYLRFVPTASHNQGQTANISFRAWDQISGTEGTKADVSTNSGSTAFSAGVATASISVTAVNDGPTITGLPTDITVTENTASNVNLSEATLSDPDSGGGIVTLTLSVSSGTLSAASGSGVTVSDSGTATLTLSGSAVSINDYLNSPTNIKYTGAADTYGNDSAVLTLTADDKGLTGAGGVLSTSATVNIDISAIAPTITNVTTAKNNGTYGLDETFEITVQFSHTVAVTGMPQLTLETGTDDRIADYIGGSGGNTLTFIYTARAGDETSDLDYTNTSALSLNSGTIKRGDTDADLTLPVTGAAGSLGANKDIEIAAYPPVSLSVSHASIEEAAGASTITATLPVISSQDVVVALSYSGTATNGTDYNGTASATITIPAGSLSASAAIGVTAIPDADTEGDETIIVSITGVDRGVENGEQLQTITILDDDIPTVTSVSSSSAEGSYKAGDIISVQVSFSAPVTVTGTPQLLLDTGSPDRAIGYILGSGTAVLTFEYIVQAGDTSADLDYAGADSLSLNGGTITSSGLDVSLVLPDPGAAGSLGAGNAIVIDTAAPGAPSAPDMTAGSDSGISDTDNVTSVTTPTFSGTAEANCNVTVYDTDGTTLLGIGTADGSGNWSITSSVLVPGSHTITAKAADAAGNVSAASLGLTVTIDTAVPGAPSAPDMTASSDNGASDADNITNVTTPTLTGTAEANCNVTVYDTDGTTLLGIGTADGSGNWSITSSVLAPGSHTITAKAADAAGNVSAASPGLTVTIDTTAPYVSSINRQTPANALTNAASVVFRVTFSESVTGVDIGDFTLTAAAEGTIASVSALSGTVIDVTVNAISGDGTLRLDLNTSGTGLLDAAGNAASEVYTGGQSYTIDSTAPTVTITSPLSAATNTSPIPVTITFTESVTGFTAGDLTVGNGTAANFSGSGATYTADILPSGQGAVTVDVAANAAQDEAGNMNAAAQLSRTYDTAPPSSGGGGTITANELASSSVKLTWTAATDNITAESNLQYKAVYSLSNNISTLSDAETNGTAFGGWSTNISSNTVTGLISGTEYHFNVIVRDEAGNKAVYTNVSAGTTAVPDYDDIPGIPSTPPDSSAVVEVNGQRQDAGTSVTTTTDGQSFTTITVDDTKLNNILESSGRTPTVTLVSAGSSVTVGRLNGQTVKNMENKEATLEIKTDTVTYTLPASHLNIGAVSALLGSEIELKDIIVSVRIAESAADTVRLVEDAAIRGGYQLVIKPVEFEITCTAGDQTVEVSRFSGYVERTIAIPDGVDPKKITTGIVLNADGTFSHVPTQIVVIDGRYYARINSLMNSTYSVIYNPVTFTDAANHWAKDAVNDMGSRMVVTGIGNGIYEPERSITRAEFAAIIVRALGLQKSSAESSFSDVTVSDWFNGYVDTAAAFSLITGYDSASFAPNDTITREQAMTILARAMKLTGLNISLTDSEIGALLSGYTDGASVSSYAKAGVAACINTGIVTGTTAVTLSPKDSVTRAEVAVMVQRLLENSGLI